MIYVYYINYGIAGCDSYMLCRDAAHIHVGVGEFIEKEYSKDLRPFYIM